MMKKIYQTFLVLLIFALTGSTTAILSGYIMSWLGAEPWSVQYVLGYLFFIFPLYQILILLFAAIFGKFNYFFERQKFIVKKIKSIFAKSEHKENKKSKDNERLKKIIEVKNDKK